MNLVRARHTLLGLAAGVSTLMLLAAPAFAGRGPATPNFNLEAQLRPVAGVDDGFGLVKFRQPKDGETTVNLDLWVRDLAPTHSYYLERATDSTVDDDCTGTNWLKLGQGLDAQAFATDERGTARADLFRSLPANLLGTEFDIQFRVTDATSSVVVLQSDCYQFTVSQ